MPFCPVMPLLELGVVRLWFVLSSVPSVSPAPVVVVAAEVVLVVAVLVVGWVVICVVGCVVTAVVGMVVGALVPLVGVLLRALVLQPERSIAINATAQTI